MSRKSLYLMVAMCLASCVFELGAQDRISPARSRRVHDPCPGLDELGYERKTVAEISLNLRIDEDFLPPDCSEGLFGNEIVALSHREWLTTEFNWEATDVFHQPLYWEDAPLERYGQGAGPIMQPVLSGAHFFGTFPAMPYKMGLDRPYDRVYALGYYRPGSPTPQIGRKLPWELDAAALESGAWVGLIFLVP